MRESGKKEEESESAGGSERERGAGGGVLGCGVAAEVELDRTGLTPFPVGVATTSADLLRRLQAGAASGLS